MKPSSQSEVTPSVVSSAPSTETPDSSLSSITRRELLIGSGKIAIAAAVSSLFSPFNIYVKAATPKSISFWQFYGPGGGSKMQDQWFQDMVKSWNSSHDVKVELLYVPNQEYMNGSKLQTAFASGQGPDIFIISPGDFLRYYNGGVLVDLSQYMEDAAKKDFFENVMETRTVDGKIYGLPKEVEPLAMYYSHKEFDDAKLPETDVLTTWDQLL